MLPVTLNTSLADNFDADSEKDTNVRSPSSFFYANDLTTLDVEDVARTMRAVKWIGWITEDDVCDQGWRNWMLIARHCVESLAQWIFTFNCAKKKSKRDHRSVMTQQHYR